MRKNFDNAIELFPLSEEELEKINRYSLRELKAEEIFAFSVALCDNEIDRDFECFDTDALNKLSSLFVGKTGILNHEMRAENQVARIYSTEVLISETEKTSYGEKLSVLKAQAYMLRSDKNKPLIDEICAGIKKEVSINCSVSEIICSKCKKNIKKHKCEHIKGRDCHHILKNPTDAYEWSFVAVPAQRKAGTVKSYGEENIPDEYKKYKEIADKYKSFLREEIVRLTHEVTPEISVKSVKNICMSLDVDALEQLRDDCKKAEGKRFSPQLVKEENKTLNDDFKI